MSNSKEGKISEISSPKEILLEKNISNGIVNLILGMSGKSAIQSNLSDKNLTGANYDGYDLFNSIFYKSILKKSSFVDTVLDDCDFRDCDLEGADMRVRSMDNIYLNEANLRGANLEDVIMNMPELIGTIFDNCNLSGAVIICCTVGNNTSFKGANLRGVEMEDINVAENAQNGDISFEDADLAGADIGPTKSPMLNLKLSGAKLNCATLINSISRDQEMEKTDFSKARIEDTLFKRIIFTNCRFSRSKLKNVKFSHCTFSKVTFNYSSIEDVIFKECEFNGCSFKKVSFETGIEFKGVMMTGCTFNACTGQHNNIVNISFKGVDSELIKCSFVNTNISFEDIPFCFFLKECIFTDLVLYIGANNSIIKRCRFENVNMAEYVSIEESVIKGCIFTKVHFDTFNFKRNNIKNTVFENCEIFGSKLKYNIMKRVSFQDTSFNNTSIKSNSFHEVKFQDIDIDGSRFSNNGKSGYTFTDTTVHNTQIEKDIPGITYPQPEVTIETDSD